MCPSASSQSTSINRMASAAGPPVTWDGSEVKQPSSRRPPPKARLRSLLAIQTLNPSAKPSSRSQPCTSGCVELTVRAGTGQLSPPSGTRGAHVVAGQRRGREPPAADVEHQPGHSSQVVGQLIPEGVVDGQDPLAHGQVLVPLAELDPGPGQGVIAIDDRRVE